MVLIAAAIAVALTCFLYGCHRYLLDKSYNLPPGPTPLPFIGNLYLLNLVGKSWATFRDLSRKYGSIFTFYLGHFRVIIVNSPELIHEAIVGHSKVLSSRPVVLPGFDQLHQGILVASGSKWQANRRFTLRAMREFGMGKMGMVDRLHDEVSHLIAEMEATEGKPFVPKKFIGYAVGNIICSIVFGKRFNYGDPNFVELSNVFDRLVSRPISKEAIYYLLPIIRHFTTHPQVNDFEEAEVFVKRLLEVRIAEHRQDFDPESIRDFPDLFIQLEQSEDGIDFDSFNYVMNDMFGAGTETTTTAIAWTLLYLCKHPEAMNKCQEEIDNVIGTSRLPTLADRSQLTYVDAVMCEILRIVTVLPLSLFHANLDGEAKVGGYDVPAQTVVGYNIWALHHDENYWKNPEEFDPSRFLDAKGKLLNHSPYFMPFGLGPRICLGEGLARVEYFVFVVSILQRFNFSLVDKNVSVDAGLDGVTHSPPTFEVIATRR